MVIPWVGVSLASVLKRFEPTSKAKYVYFETLYDPKQMPGQRGNGLDWPYREGLRIDEAKMFNGYEEDVASLYAGMDLKRFY